MLPASGAAYAAAGLDVIPRRGKSGLSQSADLLSGSSQVESMRRLAGAAEALPPAGRR